MNADVRPLRETGVLFINRDRFQLYWLDVFEILTCSAGGVCPPDSDAVCLETNGLCLSGGEDLEEGVQFSVWVSFYEIYNEFLYDLLDALPSLQSHKRATLRLSDDKHGNPYVKGKNHTQSRSYNVFFQF